MKSQSLSPAQHYQQLLNNQKIRADAQQQHVVLALDQLWQQLQQPAQPTGFWRFFRKAGTPPQGLYIWGGVGRGSRHIQSPVPIIDFLLHRYAQGLPMFQQVLEHTARDTVQLHHSTFQIAYLRFLPSFLDDTENQSLVAYIDKSDVGKRYCLPIILLLVVAQRFPNATLEPALTQESAKLFEYPDLQLYKSCANRAPSQDFYESLNLVL